MGLLDDAIREHLDLKRRRGADPTEIERLEREALGPVRRGTGDVQTAETGLREGERSAEGWDDSDDDQEYDVQEIGHDASEPPETITDEHRTIAPESTRPFAEAPVDREAAPPFPDPRTQADRAADPIPRAAGPDHVEPETSVYDVEHDFGREAPDKTDDMLEETPEFLQDTPEDSRLWFEQRPPKDFDFDG
ncbi:MAG: hypothetical protein JO372_18570 [Solirubrobacterales bacterium]|nr:hypothetical protein [Solirubrobacterales bacterium]